MVSTWKDPHRPGVHPTMHREGTKLQRPRAVNHGLPSEIGRCRAPYVWFCCAQCQLNGKSARSLRRSTCPGQKALEWYIDLGKQSLKESTHLAPTQSEMRSLNPYHISLIATVLALRLIYSEPAICSRLVDDRPRCSTCPILAIISAVLSGCGARACGVGHNTAPCPSLERHVRVLPPLKSIAFERR